MLRRGKLLEIAAEYPASGAGFVGQNWGKRTRRLKTKTQPFSDLILHAPQFFTSPTLPLKLTMN